MATRKQKHAARENIKKARRTWKNMSPQARSRRQPEGRSRAKPGTREGGDYYRVVVRPKEEFATFRTHDIGRGGHSRRIAGRRKSGSWSTQAWLIAKEEAHRSNGNLVADSSGAKKILSRLGSRVHRVKGDIFEAKPRRNVPESGKPTPAQKRARRRNIKKAQKARHG